MTKDEKLRELEEKISKKKAERDYYKAMQLALKLTLNGTYGAFANKYFVCSNAEIANAITKHGRDVNQFMMEKIENHFYEKWHCDTDQHRRLGTEYIGINKDGKYQAYTIDMQPLGWGHDELSSLLRMKGADEEDLIDKKFTYEGIEFLYEYKVWDFSNVRPLDDQPKWGRLEGKKKYDGDNQMVIYGDTDSLYVSYTPIMKSVGFDNIEDMEWGRRFIIHFDLIYMKPLLTKFLDDYAKMFNVNNLHDFELETISKSSLFIKKKHYLNNIVYEDGVPYEDLSFYYPKGIEIVRSSTPPFTRKNVYRVINYLFGNTGNLNIMNVLKLVKELRKEFEMADIEEISMTTSCSNYNDKVLDDTVGVVVKDGAHFGVKASCFHNYLLNKNSEYKSKYDFLKSGRIKYYYCTHPVNKVFAYLRSFHPLEIVEKENVKIDMDEQFDKAFLTVVNKFLEPLGMQKINKRLSVLNSLFDF